MAEKLSKPQRTVLEFLANNGATQVSSFKWNTVNSIWKAGYIHAPGSGIEITETGAAVIGRSDLFAGQELGSLSDTPNLPEPKMTTHSVTVAPHTGDKVRVVNTADVYHGRTGVIVEIASDDCRVKLDLGNNYMHRRYTANDIEIVELVDRLPVVGAVDSFLNHETRWHTPERAELCTTPLQPLAELDNLRRQMRQITAILDDASVHGGDPVSRVKALVAGYEHQEAQIKTCWKEHDAEIAENKRLRKVLAPFIDMWRDYNAWAAGQSDYTLASWIHNHYSNIVARVGLDKIFKVAAEAVQSSEK